MFPERLFWVAWVFIFQLAALAQPPIFFSGYATNLPVYQGGTDLDVSETKPLFLDLTRVRLRPGVDFSPSTRVSLEYEMTALFQSSGQMVPPSDGRTNRQLFDWQWTPVSERHWTMAHNIDRLHLRQDFSFCNITIGRQRVAWGSGRIWNPTDLFNPINPAAFDKIEKDGADLLTTQFYLGNFTDLTLVFNPMKKPDDHHFGGRFRTNTHTYDISVMGGYFDQRVVIGGDFAGNLFLAGLRGEWIFSARHTELNDNFVKYILGIDFQFTRQLYTLVEYQHNGAGNRSPDRYDLQAWATGRIINLNTDYTFIQSIYQLHDLVGSSLGWNANLNDGSGFLALFFQYSFRSDIELQLGGQYFYGKSHSEYGLYADACYLRGSLYF